MANLTTREHLDEAPAIEADQAASGERAPEWSVTRAVTLAKCLRCGNEWLPRVASPAKCPRCKSSLWNVERAQQLPGKPAPTRKGQPRGRALTPDDPRHSSKTRRKHP